MSFPLPRLLLIAATAASLLGAGATIYLWPKWQTPPKQSAPATPGAPASGALIGGDFDLVDQNGNPRSAAGFRGQYMLVQFGYANCPDVCSIALDTMSRALDTLAGQDPAQAARVTPIFISVDPARDTVAALKDYAAHFHPRLVALTGSREQVERAAAAYKVYFDRIAEEETHDHSSHDHSSHEHGDPGQDHAGQDASAAEPGYLIAHSTAMYLMGPDGGYLAHFRQGSDFVDIARTLDQHIGS
jgi:protein SCO1/2